jgi:uncharacterized protein YndB with AHSA1/START domain
MCFVKDARTLTIVLNGPQWLSIQQEVAGVSPEELLRWFVEPSLLTQWWSQEASVEPCIGGRWELSWPAMDWVLAGQIVEISPISLVVSWVWTHQPELPARALIIRAEPAADGATLSISQGAYRQSENFSGEDEDRASHLSGWEHFLPRLLEAIASSHV